MAGEPAHSPRARPARFALRSAEVFLRAAVGAAVLLRPVSDHRHLQCHAVLVVSVQQQAKEVVVRPAAVPMRVRARQARLPLQSVESPGREAALARQRVRLAAPLQRQSQLSVELLLALRYCFVQPHPGHLILGPSTRVPD